MYIKYLINLIIAAQLFLFKTYVYCQPFDNICLPKNTLHYFDYTIDPIQKIVINKPFELFITDSYYSSISVSNQLIFACNGEQILNKNFTYMTNGEGLYGNSFASDGHLSLTIRNVIDTNQYLIFTPNTHLDPINYERSEKLFYSLLDLSLDNNNGAIVADKKNILLSDQTLGKLAYFSGCEGIWLMTKQNSDKYSAYKITKRGQINNLPVISSDSVLIKYTKRITGRTMGRMEFSHDGSILANSYGDTLDFITIFNFDKYSGKLGNMKRIMLSEDMKYCTDLSFSRNSNTLYYVESNAGVFQIVQIDLDNNLNILKKEVFVRLNGINNNSYGRGESPGSIEVGYDNNLYFFANFNLYKYDLSSKQLIVLLENKDGITNSYTNFGFPHKVNYFPVLIPRNATDTLYKCAGANYPLYSRTPLQNIVWNGNLIQDTLNAVEPGMYTMTGINEFCTYHDTVWVLDRAENIPIKRKFELCENGIANVQLPSIMEEVRWKDSGLITHNRNFQSAGIYYFNYKTGTCNFEDSIEVVALPKYEGIPDTIVCSDTGFLIDLQDKLKNVEWSDGLKLTQRVITESGTYSYKGIQGSCIINDTFNVEALSQPNVRYSKNQREYALSDKIIITKCVGETVKLILNQKPNSLEWDGAKSGDTLLIFAPKTYQIKLNYNNCTYNQEIVVQEDRIPQFTKVFSLCPRDSVSVFIPPLLSNLMWSDNSSVSTSRVFKKEGNYSFTAQSLEGCTFNDSILITKSNLPEKIIFDTTICEGNSVIIRVPNTVSNLKWENGDTSKVRNILSPGRYFFNGRANNCSIYDTMNLAVISAPHSLIPDSIEICKDQNLPIVAGVTWENFTNGLNTGYYHYQQDNSQGCTFKYRTYVQVDNCRKECSPILPNIINLKNQNTEFYLYYNCPKIHMSLAIYDRYGNKLSQSLVENNLFSIDLDEKFQAGVFIYQLLIADEKGHERVFTGDIYLEK